MSSQSGGKVNNKSVADALKILADRLPGLQHGRVRTFANAAELLASNYARRESFTPAEIEAMQNAEAFFDNLTGHTIVFTDQITLQPGETPIRAVARVLLHERVGHEGINVLLQSDAAFAGRVAKLVNQIPVAELDAIEAEGGYGQLDRMQLALEWLARQAESIEGGRNAAKIEGGLKGVAKQLWQAFKEMLARMFAGFSRTAAAAHEIHEVITRAREAALNGTADPTTPEALGARVQFTARNFTASLQAALQQAGSAVLPPAAATGNQRAGQVDASAAASTIVAAYQAVTAGSSTGFVPISQVFAAAQKQHPRLTPDVFMAAIQAADNAGTIYLEAPERPETITQAGPFMLRNAVGIPSTNMMVMPGALQFSLIRHKQGTPYRVKNRVARSILTGSPLPSSFVDAIDATDNERRSLNSASAALGDLLKAAVEKVAARTGMPLADVYAQVNNHFDGNPGAMAVLMQWDGALAETARRCRNHIDAMSDAIRATLPAGPLQTVIAGNIGAWMRRGYAAFDPASGWSFDSVLKAAQAGEQIGGKDARKIMSDAAVYLANQNPALLNQRDPRSGLPREDTLLHAVMKSLMDRNDWSAAMSGGPVGKNVSSLMHRKDIAPEVRALMGEETNALMRYTQSTGFQTQFLAKHQGQRTLRQIGLAAGLFRAQQQGDFNVQIPTDNHQWSGMSGVWTTPELWAALQEHAGADLMAAGAWGVMAQGVQWMHALAKRNNVAFNPFSWLVNVAGGVCGLIQTGDLALMHPAAWKTFRRLSEAIATVRSGKASAKDVTDAAAVGAKDMQRALLARLQAGGVVNNQLELQALQDAIPKHLLMFLEQTDHGDKAHGLVQGALLGNAAGRGAGVIGRAVGIVAGAAAGYRVGGAKIQDVQKRIGEFFLAGPDNVVKVTAWLRNFEVAKKAGMSNDDALKQASKRTLDTLPNYNAMWAPLRTSSRLLGFPGSFTAFWYETFRNFGNNLKLALQDIGSKNPVLRADGVLRLTGLASISTLAVSGVGQLIGLAFGGTPPDDERNKKWRKWFASPWEKDANLYFTSYSDQGVSYIAQTYLIPQASIAEIVNAAMSGDDEESGLTKALLRAWNQAGGGDSIHLTPIMQAIANKNAFGQEVTNEKGIAGVLLRLDHVAKTVGDPKAVQVVWKIKAALTGENYEGKPQTLENIGKNFVAARERTQTWDDLLSRRYRSFGEERRRLTDVVRERIKRGASPETELAWVNGEIKKLQAQVKEFEADLPGMNVSSSLARQKRKQASIGTLSTVKLTPDRKGVVAD